MANDRTAYDDGREFDTGDLIGSHEVTAVSYQERYDEEGNAERHSFVYHVEHPDQVRAREEEARQAEQTMAEGQERAKVAVADREGAILGGVNAPQENSQP
jgi:hypothetical protein